MRESPDVMRSRDTRAAADDVSATRTAVGGAPGPEGPVAVGSSLRQVDTSGVDDSLLRGITGASPRIEIEREVGPDGKFILRQEIGRGGMGRVYRALDRQLLRDVAIKFMCRPDDMSHDDFMALFWQEARITARLAHHDNIVRLLEVDPSADPPFIVMEYLDGQSLEQMQGSGSLDLRTTLQVMIGVAHGLRAAHANGICHCDLKPSNIFVQRTGRVKLLDFGLARCRAHAPDGAMAPSGPGSQPSVPSLSTAGTPAYMAPEQWRGEEADTATDLWAFGVILYRLLARTLPFAARSITTWLATIHAGKPPVPLVARCPDAPRMLCELVDRLLRSQRSERPGDIGEIIATLETVRRKVNGRRPASSAALGRRQLARRSHLAAVATQAYAVRGRSSRHTGS